MVRVYLKVKRYAQIKKDKVLLQDLAEVRCLEKTVEERVKGLPVYDFAKKGGEACRNRVAISSLKLVKEIEDIYGTIDVIVTGEPDVLVERIRGKEPAGGALIWKILLVCMVTFFGTAFTIMAYHNDIGIVNLFREVYRIFMGSYPDGINVLEIGYSFGLAVGILVFYNHVGKRKLTKDPTPMEVAMYAYEQSVDQALLELADRQGTEQGADSE